VSPARESLASLLDDFDRHADQTATVTSDGLRQIRTSYGALGYLARRFAAELALREIRKGDRVVLWGQNRAEWVAAFFGCVTAGVLAVPLDIGGGLEFAQRVVSDVNPRLLLADQEKLGMGKWAIPTLSLEELPKTIPARGITVPETLSSSDALQIVFTSGTTGEPKGVVHTHGNVLASLLPIEREMQKYLRFERPFHPIRFLHTLPLSHVFGQFMGLWIPPLLAAEVHYQTRLVAGELVEQIRRERISVLAAVPRVLDLMRLHVTGLDPDLVRNVEGAKEWKAWRRWWHFRRIHRLFGLKFWAFVCGGASLSIEGERFWNALGFVVVQGYGMTETTALVTLNHPFRPTMGTIGQVLPGREVRLSGEGEVLVRGDTISTSVWQNGRMQQQAEDWLPTGDLAEFDAAGNLRFRGRKKDVIVTSSGLNIHPEDLETALTDQPQVKAATVVETMHQHGPEPLAVLVMQEGGDPETALAAANRRLAGFQQMRDWVAWPEPDLPRTSTGKILRREVARRIAVGEVQQTTQGPDQEELNLDSLGRVQLQAELEQKYGVAIQDSALERVKTQGDVEKLVRMAPRQTAATARKVSEHKYPRWTLGRCQRGIRAVFIEAIAIPILRFLAKPKLKREVANLPNTPVLIVANHVTSYDAAFVLFGLPGRARRRVAIAMSGEMLLDMRKGRKQGHWFLDLVSPIAYFLITALFNVFPLPQFSGFRQSFRYAGEAMDRGYNVLVFPEGRRSDDGTPQSFKSGTGLLWKELGSPALPVYLAGLGELKAERRGWFRSGRVTVHVGRVLALDKTRSAEALTKDLEQEVFSLSRMEVNAARQ
jgi:long-chain acyl-CoA synthetase